MEEIKEESHKETKKWMSYVFMDRDTHQLRTYTKQTDIENDDDARNLAPNSKNYLKMIEGDTAEEAFERAQKFIQEFLANQPINFTQIRERSNRVAENARDSYVQYEDNSVLPIVPEDQLDHYKQILGID